MKKKLIDIIQFQYGMKNIKSNIWKLFFVLFFMAFISVFASFSVDKKVILKHKMSQKTKNIKSDFVGNEELLNMLKKDIEKKAKQNGFFGFKEPNKENVIVL